jgi:hypothetical protein
MPPPWIALAALLAAGPASAQHPSALPYSDLEQRTVKALSDEQITDLRAGRGMGLALPAELNGYPGPVHILELCDRIWLTADQQKSVHELHAAMKAETVPLGERLIAQGTELDRQFATKTVALANLQAATAEIGATQCALRFAHMRYHLSTLDVLTPEQVRLYGELREYGDPGGHGRGGKGHY